MATELTADEPPAVHLRATEEAAVDESCAAGEARGINTVDDLRTADKPPSFGSASELCAAVRMCGIPTVPEFSAAEARQKPDTVCKDANEDQLELSTNTKHNESGNDSINDHQEQPSQGNYSQATQTVIDLTETDVSDGMLFDGLRSMLLKRKERKQERSVLKEQQNKTTRAKGQKAKGHMDKERATAYSRFSIGYFLKIVNFVCKSNQRMELVRNSGFGYLLELDDCYVPRPFAQWVADNISTKDEAIVLRGKSIPLNPEAVSLVLGIPAGGTQIRILDEDIVKMEFLSLFGLTELPTISFFGNKLMTEELPDDVFLRCFLTVALATFLCPTSNTKPSTKYLGALVDVSKPKDLDWCSLVHKWNMSYVQKYQKDKLKQKRITTTLGGCIYQLAVRCLDFNYFGPISVPSALPRICFWKGQTIKHFSDMLIGKDGLYGALQIKDEEETCYAEKDNAWASTAKNSNIRKAIERVLGKSFPDKVKEDIFLNFQERVKDQNLTTCLIAKQVLLQTLNILSSSFNGSQDTNKIDSRDTEKLESSEHLYMPSDEGDNSGSTIKVDSNGIEIKSDRRSRRKRRKTTTQQSTTSTPQDVVLQDKLNGSTPQLAREGAGVGGTQTTQPTPCNGHINEDKYQAEMDQTMHNSRTEKQAPEKSTSLNYMLLSARLAKALESTDQDIISKEVPGTVAAPTFSGFKHNVATKIQTQVKEDIFLAYENNMKDEDLNTCIKAKGLLLDTIRIITNAYGESGDTVKVGSTGTEFNASQQSNKSGDTVKIQSNELQEENDGGHLVLRKRRKTNILSTSQQSAGSSVSKTNADLQRKRRSTNEADGFCNSPPKVQGIGKVKSDFEAQCQREHSSKNPLPEMCAAAASTFAAGKHVDGGLLKQYKRRRIDAQSSREPHDPCSIKHKKPLEALLKADKQISSKKAEEKDEAHTLHNQQEKSSSLNYMLIGETKENHVQNVAENAKEDIPTELIQSKIIFTEAKPTPFSGFQNTPIQELDPQRKNFRGRPDNLSIDINVTAQPESGAHTDEVFARGYKNISDFLDKAREKYFFADDSTPSFRISEDVDECGNIIEEHELWRPIWMKDECYNKKIESTKLKIARNFKEVQAEELDICVQGNTNSKKQGSSSSNNELSIQCAQREAQTSLMCETPHTPKPVEEIVDLTSPEVQMSTGWNKRQTCYSPWKNNNQYTTETPPLKMKKDYSMVSIIGKRLFPEEESCQQESSGSRRNLVELIEEKTSGQLEIHEENMFRQQRSTLVNRTDDFYNTNLSLGRPSSYCGKENVAPKRIVQPSRYRSSPYDCSERGPIMPHETKMYEAITFLADVEGPKPAVSIDKTIATFGQLGNSMKIGGRVQAYVINVYCRYLFNENHPRNSHKHYFFHTASEYFLAKWKNDEARIWWRQKLIKSFIGAGKAHNLSMSDKLYFPTLHEEHYFLFVVDIKDRTFFFLDSFYDENSSYHKNIKKKIISSFICIWYEAQLQPMDFNAFPVVYPKVPQQDNDTDCGIFTMKLMGWCPRNPTPIVFSPKDVPDARIRYAIDLMFSHYNILDEEKKRVKEFRL